MTLREIERASIRAFVQLAADEGYLSGRVLDYGCGKQPYRDIVEEAGAEYVGYDDPEHPAYVAGPHEPWDDEWVDSFHAVLCTQVVQYDPFPLQGTLGDVTVLLREGGHLVLTYPTTWPEVERDDLHRFTKAGMERLLTEAGFTILRHERRAAIRGLAGNAARVGFVSEEDFALGYGVIARA